MPAPSNTLVGGFVLGAAALAAGAILMFSGLHLFQKKVRAVVVFRDSVAGLAVGSTVTFRGVQIGEVREMKVHFDVTDHVPVIPVVLDLEPGKIIWTNAQPGRNEWDLRDAVRAGLRAQLTQLSLITGQMSVNLDLFPQAPQALPAATGTAAGTVEIPTIPSDAQRLKDELLGLKLPEIGAKTRQALDSLQKTLDELAVNIAPISAGMRSTLSHYDQLAIATQGQVTTNGAELARLLATTNGVMIRASAVVTSLDDMTAPQSATRADLDATLRDLADSASSLRELTHDLKRHPVGVLLR